MKKTLSYILIIVAAAMVSSCEDWLQATSSTQYQAEQIFETRDGYLDALTGVYLTMGNPNVYGRDLTWKYADLMVYPYTSFSGKAMASWQSHDYTNVDVRSDITSMWRGCYNVIANVNMVLAHLEEGRSLFSSELEYNLIKGELLALRAYMHFDIMRLFGLHDWNGENAAKLTVPYVTKYSMETTQQLSYAETAGLLFADLNEALELLSQDPVTGVKPEGFDQGPNAEGYWSRRQKHLNLYAVEGLAARVYLWSGDHAKAAEFARMALEGATKSSLAKWLDVDGFVTTYKDDERDWTFSCEHLFSLDIAGLSNLTMGTLIPGSNSGGDVFHLDSTMLYDLYNLSYTYVDGAIVGEVIDEGLEDIRGTSQMLRYSQNAYDCYKLYGSSSMTYKYRNIMPMIRMTEMYYIMAYDLVEQGRAQEAADLLDEVRLHRGIQNKLPAGRVERIKDELVCELLKEFLNEGQLLYWYRILGYDYSFRSYEFVNQQGVTDRVSDKQFILPYPDTEISYGRKQEF